MEKPTAPIGFFFLGLFKLVFKRAENQRWLGWFKLVFRRAENQNVAGWLANDFHSPHTAQLDAVLTPSDHHHSACIATNHAKRDHNYLMRDYGSNVKK